MRTSFPCLIPQRKAYSISICTTSYFSCFNTVSLCHLASLNIMTQNPIGPHSRVLVSFDVGSVSEELASQHIHFCHMALPVLFPFEIRRKVGIGDKLNHHHHHLFIIL